VERDHAVTDLQEARAEVERLRALPATKRVADEIQRQAEFLASGYNRERDMLQEAAGNALSRLYDVSLLKAVQENLDLVRGAQKLLWDAGVRLLHAKGDK
jgi:hypothetical protein